MFVPVAGGDLAVEIHDGDTPPALAIHGVSGSRKLWNWVAAHHFSLIAPDLRGRGDSFEVPGASIRQHADDMVRVLDALDLATVTVCGMSMGAYVAVDLAVRHPDRVRTLVLVDGGFPMPAHAQMTEELLSAAFAPQLAARERTWTVDEYLGVQAVVNPLIDATDPLIHEYFAHDLTADGHLRLSADTLIADATDVVFGTSRWQELTVPTWFVHAEWSTGPDSPPAYTVEQAQEFRTVLPVLREPVLINEVDHGGTVMTRAGAAVTAEVLAEALK
ncbi:Pimeloyl-ACP methyl ester carboxylesterase [Lentzea waywayandensis]|uniref:Pimeloyl-ACP methyl ester carboxylesterase n=1 Tax=Lentzea waywayandensis TaxID=84724 RepID=A0A1I6EXV7_9PSEU|nr:alpha/beta hydrolase [Lentzea waywayandensis]SFR22501.1 Pimeloyl-ACP methyl ester carboxylesterase [Lentzea waywayandensis]